MKYSWFQNRASFDGMQTEGVKLDLTTLKILLLNKDQEFELAIKDVKYKIRYIAKCKGLEDKKLYNFAVSLRNNKIFIIRIGNDKKYNNNIIYNKKDFLSLCTIISRKLKTE